MKSIGVFSSIPLAIVDVETTGASPAHDRVIDLAIIRIEHGVVVERFNTLIDPEQYIAPSIYSLTGINNEDVKGAPTFANVAQHVKDLLEGCHFVAHNARFDYAFIKNELSRQGIRFSAKCMCTVKLSRFLNKQYKRHDLSTLIDRYQFVCEDRHRAMPDAQVLLDFLKVCHDEHGEEKCQKALDHVLQKSAVPARLEKAVLDNLPNSPGVYTFYGESGEKLYIGKSINIRNRILSHFSGDHKNGRQLRMVEEIADIKIEQTSGELSALLLESFLIKKEQPLYNRMAREKKRIVVVHEKINEEGYKTIELRDSSPDDISDTTSVLRICKSIKQAKEVLQEYAEEYKLCPALLSLENGKSGCFWSQLGKCNGACRAKESSLVYNLRFDQAFSSQRIKRWPYAAPIVITENDKEDQSRGIGFVIDDWRLIASYKFDEAGAVPFLPEQYVFDYDSYKILSSFLVKARARDIRVLEKPELSDLMCELNMS